MKFYNALTRAVDPFAPIEPSLVRMYVCGPTVYDHIHIGNARPVVVFDTIFRFLRTQYAEVVYARNITDIDDKIIDKAHQLGETTEAVAARYTKHYHAAIAQLNTLPPTVEPLATAHIEQMQTMIASLLQSGHAYEQDGHVLYNVTAFPTYGALSNRKLSDMEMGKRVEVANYKYHPADFILWKPSTDDQPGWPSPWGRGRPGWHIECSAMAGHYLGARFDIHGGGQDLLFPHHENERAQSCAYTGEAELANFWIHNGYVTLGDTKMSKSLGNLIRLADLLEQAPGEVVRLALLSRHYRKPLAWEADTLARARGLLTDFYRVKNTVPALSEPPTTAYDAPEIAAHMADFNAAMAADLNTPLAIQHWHKLVQAVEKAPNNPALVAALHHQSDTLGVGAMAVADWDTALAEQRKARNTDGITPSRIEALMAERATAKADKDYARADALRDELLASGVIIEDGQGGSQWRYR